MPIEVFDAAAAMGNIRHSPVSRWPKRSAEENRIEPIASPAFRPSFSFPQGATVFTIGSCFARHIESVLEEQGFVVPTRRFWSEDSSGRASDRWMLDNYGVPAIYNEIAWAFGEVAFDPALHFVELRPGLYADVHLAGRFPLEPFDVVLARRQRIFEVTRSLLKADVLVMTLGLAEVWRDDRSGAFLNARPHDATIKRDPDRFSLHVLSYEDIHASLAKTFELIFRRCRPDLKVILTVSPVPMMATYTAYDVATANQYSKSVLRAATEAIVRKYEQIDYFPSYESVILSDRAAAWEDDQIHVRPALVEHNVRRMTQAYTGATIAGRDVAPLKPLGTAQEFIALKEAQDRLIKRQYEQAIAAAEPLLQGSQASHALRVQATAHLRLGRLPQAETLARQAIDLRFNDGGLHGLLGEILLKTKRVTEAEQCFVQALNFVPDAPRWTMLLEEAVAAKV